MRSMPRIGPFVSVAVSFLLSGCAWRTQQADHLLGPAWYRFAEPFAGKAAAFQSMHFPLLLEGGHQWGVSLGRIQRLALVASEIDATDPPAGGEGAPRGWLVSPRSGRWRWSWFYLRAPLRRPAEFVWRSTVGAHGGIGGEGRGVTLGYSSVTSLTPRHEALYELNFDSCHPLSATFVMNPAAGSEQPKRNQDTRLKKEQP